MEKNAAAGRTPSSVPMATPPPASLNASSPEFVPLSPVQTNSLNDSKSLSTKPEPTNFNLPPSYAEHNRGSGNAMNTARVRAPENTLADQRNERLMSGVASGTLDAIRERMKSMQLAAAGGNIDEYANRSLVALSSLGFLPLTNLLKLISATLQRHPTSQDSCHSVLVLKEMEK
ncbi:protein MOR1-like [Hibiscus syriacus]|uniref:protein MOR1-like n=1 Tax=Hibiscus syriacus TaxID=106335 RepID=UPI001922B16F|nr:protein MOR1-like [Hibiscus syriacus]